MPSATTLRRISQASFFVLIVYIGIIGVQNLGMAFTTSEGDEEGVTSLVASPSGYVELLDTYGPSKTCRYAAGDARLFKGCSLHYFSKTLTTFSSANLAFVLPHLLLFVILALLFGRLFCGWMCPLGLIEEAMVYFRKKAGYRHIKLPEVVNRNLALIRYGFLSAILLFSLAIAIPLLGLVAFQKELYIMGCQICPARIVLPLLGGASPVIYSDDTPIVMFFSLIGISFLVFYFSGLIFRRPWCRICPSGAMLSVFNSGSMLSKEKDVRKCTKCGICARTCLMDNQNVWLEKESKDVSTANCVRCFKCIENCPEPECLNLKIFGRTIWRSGGKLRRKAGK
jgi:polyferredoxin